MSQLVAIDEPLIRLSPPEGRPIATADRLDSHVGGAACNVAVAAAGLGIDAAVAASVGDGPLADRVETTLRAHGVRPHLRRDPHSRGGGRRGGGAGGVSSIHTDAATRAHASV